MSKSDFHKVIFGSTGEKNYITFKNKMSLVDWYISCEVFFLEEIIIRNPKRKNKTIECMPRLYKTLGLASAPEKHPLQ